jgi:hypothetical protein
MPSFVVASVVLLAVLAIDAHTRRSSVRDLVNARRQLAPEEVARVLDAMRAPIAGTRG